MSMSSEGIAIKILLIILRLHPQGTLVENCIEGQIVLFQNLQL